MASACCFQNVSHELFNSIENNNFNKAQKIIDKLFERQFVEKDDMKSLVSLILKFYIKTNNTEEINCFYNLHKENLMRRDILGFSSYFYNLDMKKSIESFNYLLSNFKLTPDNLKFIVENRLDRLLELMDGQYVRLDAKGLDIDLSKLKFYDFSDEVTSNTLKKILKLIPSSKIENFTESISKENKQKVIIDAGNVLFSKKGEVTIDGYKYLLNMVEYFKSKKIIPLVIIHSRHLKKNFRGSQRPVEVVKIIDKLKEINQSYIFETPYGMNDDYFILYCSISLKSKIITNDNYKDHIFSFRTNIKDDDNNYLESFVEDLLVKYNYNDHDIGIKESDLFLISHCIQVVNNVLYIPTKNCKFCKYILS